MAMFFLRLPVKTSTKETLLCALHPFEKSTLVNVNLDSKSWPVSVWCPGTCLDEVAIGFRASAHVAGNNSSADVDKEECIYAENRNTVSSKSLRKS